jgi:hypothetical protein
MQVRVLLAAPNTFETAFLRVSAISNKTKKHKGN